MDGSDSMGGPAVYDLIHTLRLWLWRRQMWAMARAWRVPATGDGDWIAATVAASATSSGAPVSYVSGAGL